MAEDGEDWNKLEWRFVKLLANFGPFKYTNDDVAPLNKPCRSQVC